MSLIQELHDGVRSDVDRNRRCLTLTANEPLMSTTARTFMSSELCDRYYSGAGDAEGVVSNPYGPFMSKGLPGVAALVREAEVAACEMLDAVAVNLSCLSGVHAMMCTILSTTEPGDTVMSVALAHGGHFGTRYIVERTGRTHLASSYDYQAGCFDLERMAHDFHAAGARALYLDASYYLTPHDVRGMRAALGEDAVIIYDASHTLGLIMGGQFQAPLLEDADVVCGNTHKTLPGPHKGMVAFRDPALAATANDIIDCGLYSSPHLFSMIPLATTILEMREYGKAYAAQIIANSNALARALVAKGLPVRAAGPDRYSENHQVHVLSESVGHHRELYGRLLRSNVVVGFDNSLGGDVFIRLGTQEITRRGMSEVQMELIADLLDRGLAGEEFPGEVAALMARHQRVEFSFDSSNEDR